MRTTADVYTPHVMLGDVVTLADRWGCEGVYVVDEVSDADGMPDATERHAYRRVGLVAVNDLRVSPIASGEVAR